MTYTLISPSPLRRGNWSSTLAAWRGAAYGATKAALAALTRSWAAPERIEKLGSTTLLNRAAQTDEIADVAAFFGLPEGKRGQDRQDLSHGELAERVGAAPSRVIAYG